MAVVDIFLTFLRLGLTSFGGYVAHFGYFHREFVVRRKWLSESAYADLIALCQVLPGPSSSEVGIAIGFLRAGYLGAIAAWIGFTLPSAIIMTSAGLGLSLFARAFDSGVIHGLKIAAVAIVAQAILLMATKLCPDRPRATLAVISAMITAYFSSALGPISAIFLGGIFGWLYLKDGVPIPHEPLLNKMNPKAGILCLLILLFLFFLLPILNTVYQYHAIKIFESFYRAGSLAFGGGQAALPLLQSEVVTSGWVSKDAFTTGYGFAQTMPGPLFTFTAYLGAVSSVAPAGFMGAAIALIAAFLPAFLLVFGVLPFWENLRTMTSIRSALMGINAAVVGLLLAAFFDPIWTSSIFTMPDFLIASFAFVLLTMWNAPSWSIVAFCAIVGIFR